MIHEQYEAAKQRARDQWRADIEQARQRYTAAVRAAEAEYERDRVKQAQEAKTLDRVLAAIVGIDVVRVVDGPHGGQPPHGD